MNRECWAFWAELATGIRFSYGGHHEFGQPASLTSMFKRRDFRLRQAGDYIA